MKSKDQLGDRIKHLYEDAYRFYLPGRLPVIIRIDGKTFSNYTKSLKKPVDLNLEAALNQVGITLCKEIQGVKLAYLQSDEISLLINNYSSLDQEAWVGNNLQKMVSLAAGIASGVMTEESPKVFGKVKRAVFDARAFVLPKEEVNNAFIFRQQDATRNSIQSLARSLCSHKECNHKNSSELQELCFQRGVNWDHLPTSQKRGRCIIKVKTNKIGFNPKTGAQLPSERSEWVVDNEIPLFSRDKNYIEKFVYSDSVLE